MTTIAVEIFDAGLKARLAKMIAANENPRPLTAAWALDLHGSVEDVLAAQGKPRWSALSPVTIARRKEKGHWPGKMLQVTGSLASSIQPDSGADFARVSTNKVYATTQHFGAAKGAFGRSKRGPIPWGNIPARPFMVLTPAAKTQIVNRALKWVSGNGL